MKDSAIGKRIFILRHEHYYTQERLANELGISQSRVSAIEHDHVSPTYEEICSIALVFKVSIASFFQDIPGFDINDAKESVQKIINNNGSFESERKTLLALIEAKNKIIKYQQEIIKSNKKRGNI